MPSKFLKIRIKDHQCDAEGHENGAENKREACAQEHAPGVAASRIGSGNGLPLLVTQKCAENSHEGSKPKAASRRDCHNRSIPAHITMSPITPTSFHMN